MCAAYFNNFYMDFYVSLETGMLLEILEIIRVQQQ